MLKRTAGEANKQSNNSYAQFSFKRTFWCQFINSIISSQYQYKAAEEHFTCRICLIGRLWQQPNTSFLVRRWPLVAAVNITAAKEDVRWSRIKGYKGDLRWRTWDDHFVRKLISGFLFRHVKHRRSDSTCTPTKLSMKLNKSWRWDSEIICLTKSTFNVVTRS